MTICTASSGCLWSSKRWVNRSGKSEEFATEARHAEGRGETERAEQLLRRAVQSDPQNCEARRELCEALVRKGSLEAAGEQLRRVIEQNPDDPRGYVQLAQTLYQRGKVTDADLVLDLALDLDPNNTESLWLKARIEEFRNRPEQALDLYHRILQTSPDHVETRLQIAAIQLQNGRVDQAAAMLRAVLDQQQIESGQRSAAMWMLGGAYARGERWPEAANLLTSAAQQRPMRAEDWYRVAYTCYRAGEFPLAQQAAEAALQSQGDYAPAQNLLAQLPLSLPEVPAVQTASGTEPDAPR